MTVGALVVLLGCGVVLVGLERCLFVCVRVDVRACIYTGDRSTTRCSTHTQNQYIKKNQRALSTRFRSSSWAWDRKVICSSSSSSRSRSSGATSLRVGLGWVG